MAVATLSALTDYAMLITSGIFVAWTWTNLEVLGSIHAYLIVAKNLRMMKVCVYSI
jgi:hypothetical protein